MAGQRLMTSGGWAASSRLSSMVIYHICFSGETGPSLTLSRIGNAIKPVLQETLSQGKGNGLSERQAPSKVGLLPPVFPALLTIIEAAVSKSSAVPWASFLGLSE